MWAARRGDTSTLAFLLARAAGHEQAAALVASMPAPAAPAEPEPAPTAGEQPVLQLTPSELQQQADQQFLGELQQAAAGTWTSIPITDLSSDGR